MPTTFLKHASTVLLATSAMATSIATAREPGYVIIDPSDVYATTFISIPASSSASEIEGFKKNLQQRKAAKLITWAEFKSTVKQEVSANVRRNDYSDVDVTAGIIQLLTQHQKTPFGLTWNGGIALTGNDYKHALRTFESYRANPTAPAPKNIDRSRDPIHPLNHFSALIQK